MEYSKPFGGELIANLDEDQTALLEGHFKPQILIAMPSLKDGYFEKSVILLCEYNQAGAMGFVINSPSTTSVDDLLRELGLASVASQQQPIMIGGPVQPELCWVVHTEDFQGKSTTPLGHGLSLSAAQEVLTGITAGTPPREYLLGVGYAGWGPGQLDREIEEESWWLVDTDPKPLLNMNCENRWEEIMKGLGLHLSNHFPSCKA
ncbi:MAG: YqgE/AlgH family protein [Deltaproteobacteria bacterium]|nr:YqgE/AlgH family protein [Deltaproteobacteria bacterium]